MFVLEGMVYSPSWFLFYQKQVIEEEDFPLKLGQFLLVSLVSIRHLKQSTAAHQASVRHSENLIGKEKMTGSTTKQTLRTARYKIGQIG